MSLEVEHALVEKIGIHIANHALTSFNCIFHGGEPMLYGFGRIEQLLTRLETLGASLGCEMQFSITTNGVLITPAYVDLFKKHNVSVAVSIDGPKEVHDK